MLFSTINRMYMVPYRTLLFIYYYPIDYALNITSIANLLYNIFTNLLNLTW